MKAAAAGLACVVFWCFLRITACFQDATERRPEGVALLVNAGEVLLHRVVSVQSSADNYQLPMESLVGTYLTAQASRQAWLRWQVLLTGVGYLLVPAGAATAASAWHGLWAFALLWSALASPYRGDLIFGWWGSAIPQSFFCLLVLLVAGLGAWRSSRPSPRRNLALALAIGGALLYRSTLILLPPFLLLAQRAQAKGRSGAALLLIPYLFLLPWIGMNWAVHRRLILFEETKGSRVMAAGALGYVTLDDIPPDMSQRGLRFAVGQAASHPARFLKGYSSRLRFIARRHPLLFLLALLGAWSGRKNPQVVSVALVAAYLVLMLCCLPITEDYLKPLWLLCLVLGGYCGPPWGAKPREAGPFARGFLLTGLAALMALSGCVLWVVGAYGVSMTLQTAGPMERLEAALARSPDDPWLLFERGVRRVHRGEIAAAAADMTRSLRLRPEEPEREAVLDWTLLLKGETAPFLAWDAAHPEPAGRSSAFFRVQGLQSLDMEEKAGQRLRAWLAGAPSAVIESKCDILLQDAAYWMRARSAGEVEGFLRWLAPECGDAAIALSHGALEAARPERGDPQAAFFAPGMDDWTRIQKVDLAAAAMRLDAPSASGRGLLEALDRATDLRLDPARARKVARLRRMTPAARRKV